MIFWTSMSFCHGCHMDENLQWKNDVILCIAMLSSISQMTINVWLQLFPIGFDVISYDYNWLGSHLWHLVIDLLVSKEKIPCNVAIRIMDKKTTWLRRWRKSLKSLQIMQMCMWGSTFSKIEQSWNFESDKLCMLAKFSSVLGLRIPHMWALMQIPTHTLSIIWLLRWRKNLFFTLKL